ncbi:STAS domain-containing protein [Bacillus sp. V59.32b]|uniref:STAS domain-containing protein n=1 Tax=Bacillus sp. V59.32b TaxID=1758642 RepID=UPI000E3BDF5D|nr:STAS domain-containing protein [Bacillus sp. V59.32b]RFU66498.1 STAS domain-containing protein [Bacillus sp. V59.32b]
MSDSSNQNVTIFSNETLVKSFIEIIEEIADSSESTAIIEKLGYRTGKSEAEKINMNANKSDFIKVLSSLNLKGGWGTAEITDLARDSKIVLLKLTKANDSNQGLTPAKCFISSYLAGLFSILFREDMWYEHTKEGADCLLIKISPSENVVINDLKTFLKQKEQEKIQHLENIVEQRSLDLKNVIRELSSPVIPVLNNTIVIPLFGKFEDPYASELNEKILQGVVQYGASYLLLDLTAVKELDEFTPSVIHNITNSVKLLGAETFLVGISPDISSGIVRSGMDLGNYKCFSTLQHALQYTLFIEGLEITKSMKS